MCEGGRYDKRPFRDVTEMNEALIKNWNRAVGPSDTVYHLGDVSILRPEKTRDILDSLNGKIFLIRGTHDKAAEHKLCASRFGGIKDYFLLGLNGGIKIALMHYDSWNYTPISLEQIKDVMLQLSRRQG